MSTQRKPRRPHANKKHRRARGRRVFRANSEALNGLVAALTRLATVVIDRYIPDALGKAGRDFARQYDEVKELERMYKL